MVKLGRELHRFDKNDQRLFGELLEALWAEDYEEFKARCAGIGLYSDPVMRNILGTIGLSLCRMALARRRLHRQLPDMSERDEVVARIAESPFSRLVNLRLAKQLVSWSCRDPSVTYVEFRNTDRDMLTCIVVGGVLLIRNSQDWRSRYVQVMRPIRRRAGIDDTSSLEGALVRVGSGEA